MTDRIMFSPEGVKVSRAGVDVKVASVDNLLMYPSMSSMTQIAGGTVTLGGGAQTTIYFNNPQQRIPYVILGEAAGSPPDRETYCAETAYPYNFMKIRNDVQDGAPTRVITYGVLIDNLFI
ncbi:hypothetical protein [Brucella sp. 2280]|uniref:hypothetical protein n=1 Tax=Brucella sp. 2280 TaxID=2592625 RepID=UPI0012971D3B|nr:hypothetical protein [Brucella sp. 2280]QGA55844.1 hypothetical protein GHC20_01575 [Brucella sp. 2280]